MSAITGCGGRLRRRSVVTARVGAEVAARRVVATLAGRPGGADGSPRAAALRRNDTAPLCTPGPIEVVTSGMCGAPPPDGGVARKHGERPLPGSRRWRAPVVLVDGRSGAGKTSFATECVRLAPLVGVHCLQVLALDSLYPGWHGLAAATSLVESLLTGVPRLVTPGVLPLWDWAEGRVGAWRRLDPSRPLLVEGAGALTRVTAAASDLAVWVEVTAPEGHEASVRRERALARDGETYRPWWGTWADQERAHLTRHHPRTLADLVVRT